MSRNQSSVESEVSHEYHVERWNKKDNSWEFIWSYGLLEDAQGSAIGHSKTHRVRINMVTNEIVRRCWTTVIGSLEGPSTK